MKPRIHTLKTFGIYQIEAYGPMTESGMYEISLRAVDSSDAIKITTVHQPKAIADQLKKMAAWLEVL